MIASIPNFGSREGPSLLTVGINTIGTDYFVGDLHGEGRLLYAALQEVGFNWTTDRLFAVGDLVDRGYSHAELFGMIVGKPNFYSVLGNHDVHCWSQLQTFFNDGVRPKYHESDWISEFKPDDCWTIRNFFRGLPLAIRVTLKTGLRVGIVHADAPNGMASFSELANISREYLPTLTAKSPIESLLLGRRRARIAGDLLLDAAYKDPSPDLSRTHYLLDVGDDLDLIVCGHTVCGTHRPIQAGKWIFLDTGAGYLHFDMPDAALSVLDLANRRVIQARHAEYGTVTTSDFALDDPLPIQEVPGKPS